MCENFICSKLTPPNYNKGSVDQSMPEPCFENINCQICELMYNCDYCIAKDNCPRGKTRNPEARKTVKNAGRKDH
jgi:hypothetical protein